MSWFGNWHLSNPGIVKCGWKSREKAFDKNSGGEAFVDKEHLLRVFA